MKTFFSVLFCCGALAVAAQSDPFQFKTALSFNPLVLAATDNTAMMGAEYRINSKTAVLLDAGYIFSSYYFNPELLKKTSGFTVRPGVRVYPRGQQNFLQFQVFYKQVNYQLNDWLGKDCVDRVPTYEQLQDFTYRKRTLAFNAMLGELYTIADVVLLEVYAGFGVKIKDQGPTEPGACYRDAEREIVFSQFRPHSVTLSAPVGVKLLVPLN